MNVVVDRAALRVALGFSSKIASGSSSDLLRCVHIVAQGDSLLLEVTDGVGISLSQSLVAQVHEPGEVLADVRRLSALIRALTAHTFVTLRTGDGGVVVTAPGTEGAFLGGLHVDEWPDLDVLFALREDAREAVYPAKGLYSVLSRVLPAVSRDDNRYGVNGVQVEDLDGSARWVGTDGSCLVFAEVSCEGDPSLGVDVLFPREAAQFLATLLKGVDGSVVIWSDGIGAAVALDSGTLLRCHLVVGAFPDYRPLIPSTEGQAFLSVERRLLVSALKRGARVTSGAMWWRYDGRGVLCLQAQGLEATLNEELPATHSGSEWPALGLSPRLLLGLLEPLSDPVVEFRASNAFAPVCFDHADGGLGLIMPWRMD